MSSLPETSLSSNDRPSQTCAHSLLTTRAWTGHMNGERKEYSSGKFEVHNLFRATVTSVYDFRQLQTPSKISTKSVPSLASASACDVMDDHWADTNNLYTALPAVAESRSRSMSRTAYTAFIRETTELETTLNTSSAIMLQMISSEVKGMGEAAGRSEVAAVTSRLKGLDEEGDKYPTTQTTPGSERKARFRKPQVGDRSRFRPWGYI